MKCKIWRKNYRISRDGYIKESSMWDSQPIITAWVSISTDNNYLPWLECELC